MLVLGLIGRSAGDNWKDWKDNLSYVDYAVAVLIEELERRRDGCCRDDGPGRGGCG